MRASPPLRPPSLSTTRCALTALAAAGVVLGSGRPAAAHPNHGATLGERHVSLRCRPGEARLVYGVTYTATHGLRLRFEADEDRDGSLEAAETAAAAAGFRAAVVEKVAVSVDGAAREVAWGEAYVGPADGKIRREPLAFELTGTIQTERGKTQITIDDRCELDGIYRTSFRASASDGAELVALGRGTSPTGLERALVFLDLPEPGPAPARIMTIVATSPLPPSRAPFGLPWWASALAAAAVVSLLIVAVGMRRRARRRGPA